MNIPIIVVLHNILERFIHEGGVRFHYYWEGHPRKPLQHPNFYVHYSLNSLKGIIWEITAAVTKDTGSALLGPGVMSRCIPYMIDSYIRTASFSFSIFL